MRLPRTKAKKILSLHGDYLVHPLGSTKNNFCTVLYFLLRSDTLDFYHAIK
jgi:hypothetical protein